MKQYTERQLRQIRNNCIAIINKNTGPVELAIEKLEKVNKELIKRGYVL